VDVNIELCRVDMDFIDRTPISLIEPHDGHIERIVLLVTRQVQLIFDRLMIYHRVADDRYEIWIHKGCLELMDLTNCSIQNMSKDDEYVDDAVIHDEDNIVEWTALLQPRRATSLLVTFGSGAILDLTCASARLSLRGRVRHLEDWHGPL
jgi:hypothetical protein